MSRNAKRAISFLVFAAGIILLIVGATTSAYSTTTGVIIFLCFLVVSIALNIVWGLGRRGRRQDSGGDAPGPTDSNAN